MPSYSARARALTLLHGQDQYVVNLQKQEDLHRHFKKYLLHICLTLLIIILFLIKALPLLLILIAVLLFIRIKSSLEIKKKALDFEKDFATFLVSLSASLRCGNEPLTALFNAQEMFPSESSVHKAIAKARETADSGASEAAVINGFADEIKHPELALFRSSFLLARAEGGSLATCLERLAKVVRSRQSVRRKIKAAVAMQKLSGYGICAVVLALLVFQSITAREQLLAAWEHALGGKLLVLSSLLVVTGISWMIALTRSKV